MKRLSVRSERFCSLSGRVAYRVPCGWLLGVFLWRVSAAVRAREEFRRIQRGEFRQMYARVRES